MVYSSSPLEMFVKIGWERCGRTAERGSATNAPSRLCVAAIAHFWTTKWYSHWISYIGHRYGHVGEALATNAYVLGLSRFTPGLSWMRSSFWQTKPTEADAKEGDLVHILITVIVRDSIAETRTFIHVCWWPSRLLVFDDVFGKIWNIWTKDHVAYNTGVPSRPKPVSWVSASNTMGCLTWFIRVIWCDKVCMMQVD